MLGTERSALWHTEIVARGWESKSVEGQIELAREKDTGASAAQITPEQRRRIREREDLELSRNRILRDLARATHPRYRELLEAALSHLNNKIAALDQTGREP
ncbi:MAG TPA: hypothetical protein VMI06_15435 [Terriglobia bacterium]|nr:hypothetical protein [Terriglobia bacterium]